MAVTALLLFFASCESKQNGLGTSSISLDNKALLLQ